MKKTVLEPKVNTIKIEENNHELVVDKHNEEVQIQLEEYVNLSNNLNYKENNISSGTAKMYPITVIDYN